MKRILVFIAAGLIASGGAVSIARADDTDDLISQLTTVVDNDQSSDPATKEAVKTLFASCRVYLQQMAVLTNDPGAQQAPTAEIPAVTAQSQPQQAPTTGLQTGHLQTGHLEGAHLADYPALPAVDPTDSVSADSLTPQQIAYKAAQDRELAERKQFYFQHPGRAPQQ
jgi:hypothetical protein